MSDELTPGQRPVRPEEYWESRLTRHFDCRGVGNIGLRPPYNRWLYTVKGRVFRRVAGKHLAHPAEATVLDVGSGTGFVVEQWKRLGCRRIIGSDLTSKSVRELGARHPEARFLQVDIGRAHPPELEELAGSVDVVSMVDVAYHLMTNEAYLAALANVRSVLKPGGLFLFTENFERGNEQQDKHHTVSRPWPLVAGWLEGAGLGVVARHPQYVLMERPAAFGLGPASLSWRLVSRIARSTDAGAWLIGALLAPVDVFATRWLKTSPSIEIVVCRRID